MSIPFVDLRAHYQRYRSEWMGAVTRVLDSGRYVGGPEVQTFEREFSKYVSCKFGIGVASGTDALRLTLEALGVGPGDRVVTVPFTFVSTVDAIVHLGAEPVFVDVEPRTLTMDPNRLREVLSLKPKVILPVHIYGQTADMSSICELASQAGAVVVEDAAQAHGAEYRGRRAGAFGVASCFSFYPAKNLGAVGDAGAVTTNDKDLATKILALRQYGETRKYHHSLVGYNSRMDPIQAAVLSAGLPALDVWNEERRQRASIYSSDLEHTDGIELPTTDPERTHVFHIYAIRLKKRDELRAWLTSAGIETGIHYPIPVHFQPAYQNRTFHHTSLEVAEKAAQTVLSLPMYPELPLESVHLVASHIKEWAKQA